MINFSAARRLMEKYVEEQQKLMEPEFLSGGNDLVVVNDDIIEKPYGWVFYYQPKKFLETEDIQYSIMGNSPILIMKEDGAMHILGTHRSIDSALKDYEMGKDVLPNRVFTRE